MTWLDVAVVAGGYVVLIGACVYLLHNARQWQRRATVVRALARMVEDLPEDEVPDWMKGAA